MSSAPHAVNHVGINVPDLPAGVGGAGARFAQTNGPGFRRGRVDYLTSANGIGFEMFEFIEPRTEPFRDDWEYWRPGSWHVCLTTPTSRPWRRPPRRTEDATARRCWKRRPAPVFG